MKLGPEHIGQKFRCPLHYDETNYFVLIGFNSRGLSVVESRRDNMPYLFGSEKDDWFPYEEPKKEVKKVAMSPAIVYGTGRPYICDSLFSSAAQAADYFNSVQTTTIYWPATQLIDGKEVPIQYLVPEKE